MKTDPTARSTRAACHGASRLRHSTKAWAAGSLLLLAACANNAAVYGLRPISPPQRINTMLSDRDSPSTYPVVASTQPVLEWAPYVPPPSSSSTAAPSRISYDLWIWDNHFCHPGRLLYERKALPVPRHQVERPLKPGSIYCWSVRARIETNGETRLSDWSCVRDPSKPYTGPDRPGYPPTAAYFHLVTPGGIYQPAPSQLASWKDIFAAGTPTAESDAGSAIAETAEWTDFLADTNNM